MKDEILKIQDVVKAYNLLVKNIDEDAHGRDGSRAYGGIVRSSKGLLVEGIAKNLIEIAWRKLGGKSSRLSFEKKAIAVPIQRSYIRRIADREVRNYIANNIEKYVYRFKTDVHVNIDGRLVAGVECKAYTENAMMKRIMVDFTFLKQAHKDAAAVLLQLESQLGGDYSNFNAKIHYGSFPTHTILSYFDVDLNIVTLLEGERKVDRPIHKKEFYKELDNSSVKRAVEVFEGILEKSI
ncbi:MAG: restriction endonuclease [Patescibacteria group bacterium]|nr:restriction endonuclease [Patescibacteria group bacterium]